MVARWVYASHCSRAGDMKDETVTRSFSLRTKTSPTHRGSANVFSRVGSLGRGLRPIGIQDYRFQISERRAGRHPGLAIFSMSPPLLSGYCPYARCACSPNDRHLSSSQQTCVPDWGCSPTVMEGSTSFQISNLRRSEVCVTAHCPLCSLRVAQCYMQQ